MEKRKAVIIIVFIIIVFAAIAYFSTTKKAVAPTVKAPGTESATTVKPTPQAAISDQIEIPNPFKNDYENPFQ